MVSTGTLAKAVCYYGSCRSGARGLVNRQPPSKSPPLSERRSSAAKQMDGEEIQATGRSHGGRTRKVHALADDRSRPVAITLTPGNVADINMAKAFVDAVVAPKRLLADQSCDADNFRKYLGPVDLSP